MAIVESLLIAAPMLQDYLVDKSTSEALSAGVVTFYRDNSRTILKNWYFQTGTPGNYSYLALANPMTLSGYGTIQDPSGNDVIPFYYPFSEEDSATPDPYYVTVFSSAGQLQFTRENFPFTGADTSPVSSGVTHDNYILNNRFWRNIGTKTLTNETDIVISPSQHDGFHQPDCRFIKNITGSVDSLTFREFDLGEPRWSDDIRPEYYINHTCTAAVPNETQKIYQFPISFHIRTLDAVQAIFTIQAKSASGSVNDKIRIYIYKYLGTGPNPSPDPILLKEFKLGTAWQKHQKKFTFSTGLGDNLNVTGDDSYYLQVEMPLSLTCDIDFTIPSVYLGGTSPINNFKTYDQIDPIINGARTGDFRQSLNAFQPFGWVPANNGSIGSSSSQSTSRNNVDTWPLFNLIWSNVLNTWAPIQDNTGAPVARGVSAESDFRVNRRLVLTQNLGRVLAGQDPVLNATPTFTATITPVDFTIVGPPTTILTLASSITFVAGDPVQLNSTTTLPAPLLASTTYYISISGLTPTTITLTHTLVDALAGTNPISVTNVGVGTHKIINTDNKLTLSPSVSIVVGSAVQLTNPTSSLPGGLSEDTVYYVTKTDLTSTTVTLSLNLTDAINGYFEPILTAGSGISTLQNALGASAGLSYQTDPPRHMHTITTPPGQAIQIKRSGGSTTNGGGFNSPTDGNPVINFDGQEKMSIIQPMSLVNVFIKL